MLRFLRRDAVLDDGRVLSWVSPERTGYAYPEAAGLLLSLLAGINDDSAAVQRSIAERLAATVDPHGAVGRDDVAYAFDTSMAINGLVSYSRRAGTPAHDATIARMREFVADRIAARKAVGEPTNGLGPRWSTAFGCHMLKLTLGLAATDGPHGQALVRTLADALLPLFDLGRFRNTPGVIESYLHASCYAAEGLTALVEAGFPGAREKLQSCGEWLARLQDADGGIRAWHDGDSSSGNFHADVAAQAVRIWVMIDPARYRHSIARALRFLARLQHPRGGILYRPGSQDANTWCTVFAVQAVHWARAGRPTGLLI